MSRVYVNSYRSVINEDFEVGAFTVLFGKNNAGKTNVLEAIYSVLEPQPRNEIFETLPRRLRGPALKVGWVDPLGAVYVDLERGVEFDDAVRSLVPHWDPVPD
jgi:ABC-type Mn2+/Zn2+ transport system ATPase subunit